MPLADYAHWNEDAEYMWWHEEGKHVEEREYDPDDYLPWDDDGYECVERPEECLSEGNFNSLGNGVWVCSTCFDTYVVETRDRQFVPYPESDREVI